MKPIIVVGPPRTGTSFVARVLHENLGVCMGHNNLKAPNAGNPKGFYEDTRLVDASKNYKDPETWMNEFNEVHTGCGIAGVKTPELAFIEFNLFPPKAVVVTNRNLLDATRSYMKHHVPKPDTFRDGYYEVIQYMCGIYDKLDYCPKRIVKFVDTTEKRDEDEVAEELREFLAIPA